MNAHFWTCAVAVFVATYPAHASDSLPKNWFATYVAERNAPGVLTGPVEMKWQAEGVDLVVHGDRVFITTVARQIKPSAIPTSQTGVRAVPVVTVMEDESATFGLECRDLQDGHVLWRVEGDRQTVERLRSPLCFDKYVLVRVLSGRRTSDALRQTGGNATGSSASSRPAVRSRLSESFWLLDAGTGRILHRYGPLEFGGLQQLGAELTQLRMARASETPFWSLLTQDRELWKKTILNPAGATAPVARDPAKWSPVEVKTLWKVLDMVPANGRGKIAATGEGFYVDLRRNRLVNRELASDQIRWEVPFLGMIDTTAPLYCPPFLVVYTSRSAITAYELKTGRPAWTYHWPEADHGTGYNESMVALQDGVLLLTNPQIRRPVAHRRLGGGVSSEPTTRPCLVKLTLKGELVFRQELPVRLSYGRLVLGKDALLVASGQDSDVTTWFCLSRSSTAPASQPPPDKPRIEQLVAEYDRADAFARTGICAELASLGDKRLVNRVVADLLSAVRDKGLYAQCLGLLGDKNVIPKLIPLLEDPDWQVKQQGQIAIEALTDGDPGQNPAYREWRDRQIQSLRADYDRTKYPSEHEKFASRLLDLGDPELFDRLSRSLEQADPKAQDFYIRTMGGVKDNRAIPKLIALLEQRSGYERQIIQQALERQLGVSSFAKPEVLQDWWAAHRHLYQTTASAPAAH